MSIYYIYSFIKEFAYRRHVCLLIIARDCLFILYKAPVRGSQAVVSADVSVTFDLFVVRRGHDAHLYLYQGTKRRFSLGFSLATRT